MLMTAGREGKCDVVRFLLDSLKNITDEGVLIKFQSGLPRGDVLPSYQEHKNGNVDLILLHFILLIVRFVYPAVYSVNLTALHT